MISLAIVAAGTAGLAASWIARLAVNSCRRALRQPNLLPKIAGDLRRLVAGKDTKEFLTEYLQLLSLVGRLAGLQLIMLAINFVTMTAVFAVACWPLDLEPAVQAFNPLKAWLSDVECSFLVAAVLGSIGAPFFIRSS